MMKNREFRELQVSSTQLAIIFLGILIIGVVIFLLGVSVGKKHAQVAQKANVIAQKEPEQVKEKIMLPQAKPDQVPAKEPAKKDISEKTVQNKEAPREELKVGRQAAPEQKNLYYVQVGALAEKQAALSSAQVFMRQGFPVIVMDPLPTDKKPVYRVRIGGFQTKEEAEATRSKLASAAGRRVDYFIVRY
ncbi:MAG: SPOR domain-containing protein [Acidobacteriota bacterium]